MTRIEIPNSAYRRTSRRGARWLAILVLIIVVGAGLWTWLTLAWAYSDGERAGVLQKFSRKGWVCKTQEGELAQYVVSGVSPQIWYFSVRDPAVAAQLDRVVGERVQLHYTEHPGVPTACFGDTRYYVDRVTVRGDNPAPAAAPSSAAPSSGVPSSAVPPSTVPPPAASPLPPAG